MKDLTPASWDSFARLMAESLFMSSYVIWPSFSPIPIPCSPSCSGVSIFSMGFRALPCFWAEKARERPLKMDSLPVRTPL